MTPNMKAAFDWLKSNGFTCEGCASCRNTSCPRVWEVHRGKILADRKTYEVWIQYPSEKIMRVHFNGPSCGVGPVFLSTESGIQTRVNAPERFGTFDQGYPRRFFAHVQIEPCVKDPS